MATKADIDTDLTLELDGKQNSIKFLKAVSAFIKFVEEVTKASAGEQPRPEWTVQVKGGSNLVGLVPTPGFSSAIVQNTLTLVKSGIDSIGTNAFVSDEFSEEALQQLRKLAEISDDETTARIWVRKFPVRITKKIASAIAEMMGSSYQDYGSVEGRLQVVSERGAYSAEITDPLSKKPVKCHLNRELIKESLSLFGQRVAAYGKIHYRKDGNIVSIDVEEFTPFPPPEKIPSFVKVHGIFRDQ
ncbi:MAG: hypothetical protein V1721_04385 [Pseudomonadota bacterium]